MQLLYVDESGNSHTSPNNTHFVLAGVAMDAAYWKQHNAQIDTIKQSYALVGEEIHTAWMLKNYSFESGIPNFSSLDYQNRKQCAQAFIQQKIASSNLGARKNIKKDWKIIQPYSHLLKQDRFDFINDICLQFSQWGHMRIFLIIVDKRTYKPTYSIYEDAFEQLISRFQRFIQNVSPNDYGIVAMDNNQTVANKITALSNFFHSSGTRYVNIPNIIDTPYFVDSKMTSMIQLADIASYGARKHYEKGMSTIFNQCQSRIDSIRGKLVGLKILN